MIDILVRYLHYIAAFVLFGAVIIKNMAVKANITGEDGRNLAKVGAVAMLSAILVFLFGLLLWLWLGKPAAFYSTNPVFHIKLGLFAVLLLLAVYPARFFFLQRNSTAESIAVPKAVQLILRAELALLIAIAVFAALMARGIGLSAGSVAYAAPDEQLYNITVSAAGNLDSDFESLLDIVIIYDAAVIDQLPFQQFNWISRRDVEIARLADSIAVVSLSISAESEPEQVTIPTSDQEIAGIYVFASHEDPVAEAIDISLDTTVELRVESWGINVISD